MLPSYCWSIPVTVTGAEQELVYEVTFDDGSLCSNLLKQYILVSQGAFPSLSSWVVVAALSIVPLP